MVMAHGLNSTAMKRGPTSVRGVQKAASGDQPMTAAAAAATSPSRGKQAGIGSRRIFPPHFKLQVLDSYRQDADCKGNQRATARKYGIHRRQIQKWLQAEANLRSSVSKKQPEGSGAITAAVGACAASNNNSNSSVCVVVACNPSDVLALETRRQRDDAKPPLVADAGAGAAAEADTSAARLSPAPPARPLDCSMQAPRGPATPADIKSPALLLMPMDLSVKRAPAAAAPTARLTRGARVAAASAARTRSRSRSPVSAPAKPLFKPYLLKDEDAPAANNNTILHNCNSSYDVEYKYAQYAYPHGVYESLDVGYVFDESGAFQPAAWLPFAAHALPPMFAGSQRNSYSLEFKLRTIDSYYQDECCKGNQRAVAHKFNIHRRQVQKWLKQESELRERKCVCTPASRS